MFLVAVLLNSVFSGNPRLENIHVLVCTQNFLLHSSVFVTDEEKYMSGSCQTETQMTKKADELVKIKHNGVVRIRFQASFLDPQENMWKVAVAHSQPVHDQSKSACA